MDSKIGRFPGFAQALANCVEHVEMVKGSEVLVFAHKRRPHGQAGLQDDACEGDAKRAAQAVDQAA